MSEGEIINIWELMSLRPYEYLEPFETTLSNSLNSSFILNVDKMINKLVLVGFNFYDKQSTFNQLEFIRARVVISNMSPVIWNVTRIIINFHDMVSTLEPREDILPGTCQSFEIKLKSRDPRLVSLDGIIIDLSMNSCNVCLLFPVTEVKTREVIEKEFNLDSMLCNTSFHKALLPFTRSKLSHK